ncbi:MAG TPA: RluA family pseudouridine synthase [Nitrospirales bacterium]|nr:RluA family pseudouridine synthase [Nitrospirales bacterium]HIB54946.1 RluA family pseudouridine synthase [Nitrospirales bacterium]HIC05308.1 RluA family pseudouridine synthase [Nitrospirales bacterium]HIO21220.1 RluA family pseudouridine synthase [Nitrospirales bacterium]HIO69995.1 RluA family pseudouridine synthase [Nitrospirales bacterium]
MFTVASGESPKRLDHYLTVQGLSLTRMAIQRLVKEGQVMVNGAPIKSSYRVRPLDVITVDIPAPTPIEIRPEAIPLDIVYEDEVLVVLNKAAGIVVHPAPGNWTGTLVNALLGHLGSLSSIGGRERPGLVHRLDKGTSGVMVVAKTDSAHQLLAKQFKAHSITRVYRTVVAGSIKKSKGTIDLAIGRDMKERKKMSSRTAKPRASVTEFQLVERVGKIATILEIRPQTGRTHQIRVHLSSIGHPVVGDVIYGGRHAHVLEDVIFDRPMLHAAVLGFTHPIHQNYCEYEVPIPDDMKTCLTQLKEAALAMKGRKG